MYLHLALTSDNFADSRVFHILVKRWLQELKDDMEEPLQARFIFKSNLTGSLNQIFCSLSTSVCQIIDGFSACEVFNYESHLSCSCCMIKCFFCYSN